MILQKKADRRRRRAESVAKVREDTKEQIPPAAPAGPPIKYQHDTKKQDQGDYQATPKYQPEVHPKTTTSKHPMYGNGDYNHNTSPKHHQYQQGPPPADGGIPSPTDKPRVAHYGSSQSVNNNNSVGYGNYQTQPQQNSFAVGKCKQILISTSSLLT